MRLRPPFRRSARGKERPLGEGPAFEPSDRARRSVRDIFIALSVRNFRLFWFGQLISLSGTWMQTVGQAWLVLSLTKSPVALGTVTTLQFLPFTLFVLFAGVVADRVPKRNFLVVTQTAAMLLALTLGLLVCTGAVRLWHIYLIAFALGFTNAFDNPTRQAFVPEMVGKKLLANAVPLNSSLFNAARIIGPAIGGVAIAVIGLSATFYLNAASFIPVIGALLMMRQSELFPVEKREGRMFAQLKEGIAFAFRTPAVLLILMLMAFVGTFGYNFTTALPLLAQLVLHVQSVGFGAMTAVLGIGSLLAALAIAYSRRAGEKQIIIGGAAFSLLIILLGLSRWFGVTLFVLVLIGFASIIFAASANTRLQLLTPDHLRGRVMSLYVLLFAGTTPIGSFLLGHTAARIGVQRAVVLFGVMSALGVGVSLIYRASRARSDGAGGTATLPHAGV